jgi:import inner membrane translocase subunit TIM22
MTQMQTLMESCPAKTVISGTMGFALGGVFGLFMASVCGAALIHTHDSH